MVRSKSYNIHRTWYRNFHSLLSCQIFDKDMSVDHSQILAPCSVLLVQSCVYQLIWLVFFMTHLESPNWGKYSIAIKCNEKYSFLWIIIKEYHRLLDENIFYQLSSMISNATAIPKWVLCNKSLMRVKMDRELLYLDEYLVFGSIILHKRYAE